MYARQGYLMVQKKGKGIRKDPAFAFSRIEQFWKGRVLLFFFILFLFYFILFN